MSEKTISDFDKTEELLKQYAKLDIDIKAKECEIKSEGLKSPASNHLNR